ncbi:MAG TPA: ABC transporter permease [Acidimicrobiales bacterium]|jgi:ABC-2 type transport system permease protein|nr:ABC transporter permease [Acidimicrobiales bacterium]
MTSSAAAAASSASASASAAPSPESTRSFQGFRDLRLIGRQVRFEQLSFWLNPFGALFTIVFSVLFLVLLSSTAGSQNISYYAGIKATQYYVPSFIAYGIMSSCFNIQAITLVNRREMGLLKRLRLSPLPTPLLMAAIFISSMIVAAIGVILLFLIGKIAYGVHGPASTLAVVVTTLVGMLAFTGLAVGMSTVVPNADAAGPMVSLTFFLLVAFSGLYFPIQPGSTLSNIADIFPVRHMISGMNTAFNAPPGSSPWPWHDYLVLLAWGVVGSFLALRRWSWSPRRG